KGFDGCTSREIAKAAGENVALVNYYFRSKSQLFKLIFEDAMEEFVNSMVVVFGSERSLKEKMAIFIEKEYDFLAKHPEIPSFLLNEMNREDGCSIPPNVHFEKIASTGVFEECMKAQQEGKMRPIDLRSIPLLIMSNCHYPVMAKNLMMHLQSMTAEEFDENLKRHREHVAQMLVDYLFPEN
ncbi:MAG: TetR family transcriptional regulator, partial [Cryomorphaceae bacterium]|nr:TetR family transcriptional regulator [Cryomorphaceae bacterium]